MARVAVCVSSLYQVEVTRSYFVLTFCVCVSAPTYDTLRIYPTVRYPHETETHVSRDALITDGIHVCVSAIQAAVSEDVPPLGTRLAAGKQDVGRQ